HTRKSRNSALFGSIVGTLVLTFIGSLFNAVYLLPKFSQLYGIPMDAIIAMGAAINGGITNVYSFVMLAVAPLNLIKGTMISTLTMLLYKKVARPLFGRNV
ncbi:MAG: ECF transporter S component, partial [Oscillospiraceae bacterium]|nr:ECF transporter S component [Oscillospiraceae bacterium]